MSATTSASPAASTTRFTTFWPRIHASGRSRKDALELAERDEAARERSGSRAASRGRRTANRRTPSRWRWWSRSICAGADAEQEPRRGRRTHARERDPLRHRRHRHEDRRRRADRGPDESTAIAIHRMSRVSPRISVPVHRCGHPQLARPDPLARRRGMGSATSARGRIRRSRSGRGRSGSSRAIRSWTSSPRTHRPAPLATPEHLEHPVGDHGSRRPR